MILFKFFYIFVWLYKINTLALDIKSESEKLSLANHVFNTEIFAQFNYQETNFNKWKQNGTTVAGGNGEGQELNQFNHPIRIFVDQNKNIFIVKNEIRRWKIGEKGEGILVAGGNGRGNQLNQLNFPTYIFVDNEQSIYVSDSGNHRVMKWNKDAKEGLIVAGGNRKGDDFNQLSSPGGLFVDNYSQIYVADTGNHRIMRWSERAKEGEIIVGGNEMGLNSNQLYVPTDLSFDLEGNLYVADYGNNRIQRFDLISNQNLLKEQKKKHLFLFFV